MTEEQKYQGSTYKSRKAKSNEAETATGSNKMAHHAYVEDVTEEYEAYRDYQIRESDGEDGGIEGMPAAPSPPPASRVATAGADANVNVFDFLVQATPNTSSLGLQQTRRLVAEPTPTHTRQLVRFESDPNEYLDAVEHVDDDHMVQYGDGPITATQYETPAPKSKKNKDSDAKKDKKRKRLHIETPGPLALEGLGDEVMTDAPPVLHSGLTGGMDRMMRPSQFPPSPDYSGGDGGDNSPIAISHVKKSKQKSTKTHRAESHGLKALLTGSSKTKASTKKRKHSTERKEKKKKTRHHRHRSDGEKAPKLIEFRPPSSDGKDGESGQMIVYRPRSDLFLSLCNKGPDSGRGCSMNKVLKRYYRERSQSENCLGKTKEEKELFRSLRMRRNERGEIVLFTLSDDEE